jgi:hypothetical protein
LPVITFFIAFIINYGAFRRAGIVTAITATIKAVDKGINAFELKFSLSILVYSFSAITY